MLSDLGMSVVFIRTMIKPSGFVTKCMIGIIINSVTINCTDSTFEGFEGSEIFHERGGGGGGGFGGYQSIIYFL